MSERGRTRLIGMLHSVGLEGLIWMYGGCVAAGVCFVLQVVMYIAQNLTWQETEYPPPNWYPTLPVTCAMIAGGAFLSTFSRCPRWLSSLLSMPLLYVAVTFALWNTLFWEDPTVWERFLPCLAAVVGIVVAAGLRLPKLAREALSRNRRSLGMWALQGVAVLLGVFGVWSWRFLREFNAIMSRGQMAAAMVFFLMTALILVRTKRI